VMRSALALSCGSTCSQTTIFGRLNKSLAHRSYRSVNPRTP